MSSPSSLTFTPSVLRSIVAKICHDVGWHSAHVSSLNVLSDLLHHYLHKLSSVTVESAILAGRCQPTLEDMALAFQLMNIDLIQLQDYVVNVEPSPLEFQVPRYPCSNRSNRVLGLDDPDEERPEYYDEWLPSLKMRNFDDIHPVNNDFKPRIPHETLRDKVLAEPEQKTAAELSENSNKEKNEEEEEEDDQKTKLVVKFNLGRSAEESTAASVPENGVLEAGKDHTAAIAGGTGKTTLFQASTSNDIVNHLMESKAYLRFIQSSLPAAITEPPAEGELRNRLRFPDSQRLPNGYLSRENSPEPEPENPELNPSAVVNTNLMDDVRPKKGSKKKNNKLNDGENTPIFGEMLSIKVKEPGKKRNSGEKPPRPKKPREPSSKLVSKINLAGLNENSNQIDSKNDGTTPKKRIYKKKTGENAEPRKAKPKKTNSETKLSISKPDFVPSPLSEASFSFKLEQSDSFNEMSASKINEVCLKPGGDGPEFGAGNESYTAAGDSAKKKMVRPTTIIKRGAKTGTVKKVISAEVVESSGGSSSDSDDNVDRDPVSLLVPPLDSNDFSILPPTLGAGTNENSALNRERRDSNSSVSSVASAAANDQSENRVKATKSEVEEQPHKIKDPSKHKKSKKHSKNKHRHSVGDVSGGDGTTKPHKKHKKAKDKERIKDPTKVKQSDKDSSNKGTSKSFKHKKLNIKFGHPATPEPMLPPEASLLVDLSVAKASDGGSAKTVDNDQSILNKKSKKSVKLKKIEAENELVFIKDPTSAKPKESKTKKNQVINMGASLLALDSASSLDTGSGRPKTKAEILFDRDVKKIKVEKLDTDFNSVQVSGTDVGRLPSSKKEKTLANFSSSKDGGTAAAAAAVKKEKETKKAEAYHQSCTLIRETINETISADDKVWLCPKCSKPDDGTPMIGCDGCEEWYHYYCVGIQTDPNPQDTWYCSSCYEKRKKKKEKRKSKQPKQEEQHSVTITPIPAVEHLSNFNLPAVSIYPVSDISPTTMLNTCSTPGYKPTGRPRGRPRKDSGTSSTPKQPVVTITAIGGASGSGPPSSSNSQPQRSSEPNLFDQQRQVYHSAQHRNVGGGGTSGISLLKPMMANPMMMMMEQQPAKNIKEICPKCQITQDFPVNMIECDSCDQWYHWPCVGITMAPSPNTKWYCPRCAQRKAKKQQQQQHSTMVAAGSKRALEPETMHPPLLHNPVDRSVPPPAKSRRLPEMVNDAPDQPTNMCGACKQTHTPEADPRWIQCDACDLWYHFICENILDEPTEETWFCRNCINVQKNIISRLHVGSSKKRR